MTVRLLGWQRTVLLQQGDVVTHMLLVGDVHDNYVTKAEHDLYESDGRDWTIRCFTNVPDGLSPEEVLAWLILDGTRPWRITREALGRPRFGTSSNHPTWPWTRTHVRLCPQGLTILDGRNMPVNRGRT